MSDFAFSHVLWNQNFEVVSSSHSNHIHSESKLLWKRKNACADIIPIPAFESEVWALATNNVTFPCTWSLQIPQTSLVFQSQYSVKMADVGYQCEMHSTPHSCKKITHLWKSIPHLWKSIPKNHIRACIFCVFRTV